MIHFVPGSYPLQTKRISCDATIGAEGKPFSEWHTCNAKASIEAESRTCEHMWLHFCPKHAKRATASNYRNVKPL